MPNLQNLKTIRKARKMTQKELADIVGVSESSISQYESGTKSPSFEVALKIAEALDCESADLVTERKGLITLIDEEGKKIPATESDGLSESDSQYLVEKNKRLIDWFRSLPEEKQKAILISQDAPEDLL